MKIRNVYVLPMVLLVYMGCQNAEDTPVNLKSDVDSENTIVGTEEGGYLYLNYTLSEPVSKDVVLTADLSTQDIANYTNGSLDYATSMEYSNNGGISWKKEADSSQVRFERGSRSLKVRIATKEDDLVEVDESFIATLKPVDDSEVDLTDNIQAIRCTIIDKNREALGRGNEQLQPGVLMTFFIQSTDGKEREYVLSGVQKTVEFKKQKEIIDGEYKKILEDAMAMARLATANVVFFELLYDNASGIGGYVSPLSTSATEGPQDNNWIMGMNAFYAFNQLDSLSNATPQEYNADGYYGRVLTHETGHLLTLSYGDQIYLSNDAPDSCTTLAVREGCTKPEAYINKFNTNFYLGDPKLVSPAYVTDYARTNEVEDIAETFSFYVGGTNIPSINNDGTSDGALRKMHFIGDQTGLASLKDTMREIVTIDDGAGNRLREFGISKNGKRISCLDRGSILHVLKEQHEHRGK